jgi:hypothetical protein
MQIWICEENGRAVGHAVGTMVPSLQFHMSRFRGSHVSSTRTTLRPFMSQVIRYWSLHMVRIIRKVYCLLRILWSFACTTSYQTPTLHPKMQPKNARWPDRQYTMLPKTPINCPQEVCGSWLLFFLSISSSCVSPTVLYLNLEQFISALFDGMHSRTTYIGESGFTDVLEGVNLVPVESELYS